MNESSLGVAAGRNATRGKWAWGLLTLAAFAMIFGSGQAPRLADPGLASRSSGPLQFVKIGKRYINLHYVTSVEEYPGRNGLKLFFVGDKLNFLYFGDAEADALRKCLDSVSMIWPAEARNPDGSAPADNPR